MRKIKVLTENETKEIAVAKGTNLLEALRKAGFVLPADCGGKEHAENARLFLTAKTSWPAKLWWKRMRWWN